MRERDSSRSSNLDRAAALVGRRQALLHDRQEVRVLQCGCGERVHEGQQSVESAQRREGLTCYSFFVVQLLVDCGRARVEKQGFVSKGGGN